MCVLVARSQDIRLDGEGFEQTKRNIKDVTFVQNELGECVSEMDGLWMGSWDRFYECEMDLGIAAHYDAGAMGSRKTKGVGRGNDASVIMTSNASNHENIRIKETRRPARI